MKRLRITIEGKTYDVEVEVLGEESSAPRSQAQSSAPARAAAPTRAAPRPAARTAPQSGTGAPGEVPSPLSGTVVSVDVQIGQEVAEGQKLITLEAMKMHTIISSPAAGKVSAILVQAGQAVEEGQVLLNLA